MSILIEFQRQHIPADRAETIANTLLKPLRLACGKIVSVSHGTPHLYIEKKRRDLISRIFFGAIAFLLFPLTLLGALFAMQSKSYQVLSKDFIKSKCIPTPKASAFDLFQRYTAWIQEKANFPLPEAFFTDLMREATALYGEKFLETHLFSVENEIRVRKRIAELQEITCCRETPAVLAHEKGTENTNPIELAISLEKNLEECISKPFNEAHAPLTNISHLQDQMREQINVRELRDLESLLNAEVGTTLAREILQDWDYIGTDIRDNTAILSSARKEKILEKARLASKNQEHLQEILKQLKVDLARDLPPRKTIVFHRYSNLPELLALMPQSKTEILHQMMAQALLNREIGNPTAFAGPRDERHVIEALDFSLKNYEEREKIHFLMTTLLNPLLQDKNLPSVDILKQNIKDMACNTRLQAAGVPFEKIPSIRSIISSYTRTRLNWGRLTDQEASNLQESLPIVLPQAKKQLFQSIRNRNRICVLDLLEEQLQKYKEEFFSILQPNETTSLWQEKIHSQTNQNELMHQCANMGRFQKKIDWFTKYQNLFIEEFSQGESDPNEALQDGVCYGLVYRLARATALYPDLSIEELKTDTILPTDRLVQAAAILNKHLGHIFRMPPELALKQGIREIPLFLASPSNIIPAIVDQMGNLTRSNGGMVLGRGGHATFLCLDEPHNRFFFSDSNYGTLKFQLNPKEEIEELAVRMAICYEELYAWAYDPTGPLLARRIVPLAPGEKLPAPLSHEQYMASFKSYK
jgi:hypothetical protein